MMLQSLKQNQNLYDGAAEIEYIESPILEIIRMAVAKSKHLTPELQNAIAKFIACESSPPMVYPTPTPNSEAKENK